MNGLRRAVPAVLGAVVFVGVFSPSANALTLPDIPNLLSGGLGAPAAPAGRWSGTINRGVLGAATGIALDNNGGVVDVGWTADSSESSAFVEERDQATGTVRWSRESLNAIANAVAVGSPGVVTVGGTFGAPTDFGGGTVEPQGPTGYLASYDEGTGRLLWQRALPGVSGLGAGSIATDRHGNVTVVGSFQRPADFGLAAPIPPLGPEDVFVAKYSGLTGAPLWVRTFTSSDGAAATGVATTCNGDIVVVGQFGYFGGSITFAPGAPLQPPAEQGRYAGFVVRLEGLTGQPLWSRGFAGGGTNGIFDPQVAVDHAGDVVVAGQKGAGEDFGGGRLPNDTVFNSGFAAKYSGTGGTYRWSWALFSAGAYESVNTVGTDGMGNAVIGGDLNYVEMKNPLGAVESGPAPGHVTTARLSGLTGRPDAFFTNLDGKVDAVAVDKPGHLYTGGAATFPVITG